ncbi:MAG: methyltransferase domain-containing protein [Myxococcota bacterium]|nr:methyltransferase domain-containing protein [Myxococcota bacterium]
MTEAVKNESSHIWQELKRKYDVDQKELVLGHQHHLLIHQIKDINALVDKWGPEDFGPDERLPYWATLWPVSIELCHHLIEHPSKVSSPAIELGCGLGLVSIVIARLGHEILATDYEEDACSFAQQNAFANNAEIVTQTWDWRSSATPGSSYKTIVGADVLYEPKQIEPVAMAIDRLLGPLGNALIADPNRPHWPEFQDKLREMGFHVETHRKIDCTILEARRKVDTMQSVAEAPQ